MIVSIVKESVVDWILRTNFQFPPKLIPIEEEFEIDPLIVEIVIEDNKQQEFNVLMRIILLHYHQELNKWKLNQN